MDGKGFVVTGAASGIGRATADRLLAEGGSVIGVDIAETGPPDTDRYEFRGGVDVSDEAGVSSVFDAARTRLPRLDGVVHAAGIAGGGPVHVLPMAEWQRVIGVNLTGTFVVAKHAVLVMLEQERVDGQRGSIVTLASIEGLEGTAGGSAYNAAKGGVVLLTKNLALDYGPKGVRANAICPGFIDTPMTQGVFGFPGMEQPRDDMRREHALRRFGDPREIAAVAAFLVSADASFVSGQAIPVDGGYTAGRDHGITELLGLS